MWIILVWTCCHYFVSAQLDTTPPEIQCPPDQTVLVPDEGCYLVVEYPDAIASDDSGDVTIVEYPASGGLFDYCTYTTRMMVKVTATDSSDNKAECTFYIVWRRGNAGTTTTTMVEATTATVKIQTAVKATTAAQTISNKSPTQTTVDSVTISLSTKRTSTTSVQTTRKSTDASSSTISAATLPTSTTTSRHVTNIRSSSTSRKPEKEEIFSVTSTERLFSVGSGTEVKDNLLVIICIIVGCSVPIFVTILLLIYVLCCRNRRKSPGATQVQDFHNNPAYHQHDQEHAYEEIAENHQPVHEQEGKQKRRGQFIHDDSVDEIRNSSVNKKFFTGKLDENINIS